MNTEQSLSTLDKTACILRLLEAVREIRKVAPRMELGQVRVLFHVLSHPGATASEIAAGCEGVELRSVHKTLRTLANDAAPYGKGSGLRLIYKREARDRGASAGYFPTDRGYSLAQAVADRL